MQRHLLRELTAVTETGTAQDVIWAQQAIDALRLAQRRAEDALQAPAADDLIGLGLLRLLLAQICTLTGQPERGASIAREARQEAAEHGIEILVADLLATEAMAWTAAGDYAAARQPAMEAVEVARRVQNPALSAMAFCTAAGAIWPGEPQTALRLIEDSLALTRAEASEPVLDTALMLAGFIRARTGDLPGALAVTQEAMAQAHADGNRLLLDATLQVAAVVLARLGEAKPAAVLSGASQRISRCTSPPFTKTTRNAPEPLDTPLLTLVIWRQSRRVGMTVRAAPERPIYLRVSAHRASGFSPCVAAGHGPRALPPGRPAL